MARLQDRKASKDVITDYFRQIKFVLKHAGVSLNEKENWPYRIYAFSVIFFCNFVYLSLFYVEVFKQDFDVVVDTMFVYWVAFTLATVKVSVILRNRRKCNQIMEKLEQEPFAADSSRGGAVEKQLIKKYVRIIYVQNIAYWIVALLSVVGAFVAILRLRLKSSDYHDWKFMYGAITVFNTTYTPSYELFFVYQTITAYYMMVQFTASDLLIAALMAHICCQFKMLQNNMRRLVRIAYEKMLKETQTENLSRPINDDEEVDIKSIPWTYLYQSLKEAVNYHLAILSVAAEVEAVFSGLMLLVFLNTLGILGVLILNASRLAAGDLRLMIRLGEAMSAILQVATVCYWGEEVVTESKAVGYAAYQSGFLGGDLRFQKSLILILRRSQNPTFLTAGNFSVVALSTFVWIIRTSYSAFMMLRGTKV